MVTVDSTLLWLPLTVLCYGYHWQYFAMVTTADVPFFRHKCQLCQDVYQWY